MTEIELKLVLILLQTVAMIGGGLIGLMIRRVMHQQRDFEKNQNLILQELRVRDAEMRALSEDTHEIKTVLLKHGERIGHLEVKAARIEARPT